MTSTVDRTDQAESQGSYLEFSSNKIRDDLIFPRYLVETCSSRTQDYSVQAEGERLSNTFRTGSHWTLKKLPNHLGPGSIRNERMANRMTNLLGSYLIFVGWFFYSRRNDAQTQRLLIIPNLTQSVSNSIRLLFDIVGMLLNARLKNTSAHSLMKLWFSLLLLSLIKVVRVEKSRVVNRDLSFTVMTSLPSYEDRHCIGA